MLEEAVTKKFIHEESSSIISLCGKCKPFKLARQLIAIHCLFQNSAPL